MLLQRQVELTALGTSLAREGLSQTAHKAKPLQSTCFQSFSAGDVYSQILAHIAESAQQPVREDVIHEHNGTSRC